MSRDTAFVVVDHPTIGRVRGLKWSDSINRYLGLQYATLADRFSRAELIQYTEVTHDQDNDDVEYGSGGANSILDATRFGPTPLLPPDACASEQDLIQKDLDFTQLPISDTRCLTLSITAPSNASPSSGHLLPVLAFVHGGGFTTGSGSFPQNDLTRITEMSVKVGMPMVSVGINYRVGAPGFLHSPAMEAAGYKSNNGLDDQRLALRWIQEHVAGFGGDPQLVTYLGESAGATSGFYHLHAPEPLFHQAVSMSGSSLLRPRAQEAVQRSFQVICEALGAQHLGPRERVQRLLTTPNEEFVAKLRRPLVLGPLVDGDIIPRVTTFADLQSESSMRALFPGLQRCKRLLIGDCQLDGMIWVPRLANRRDVLPQTLHQCLARVFEPIDKDIAVQLAAAYGLDASTPVNTPASTLSVLEFGNDITFAIPARKFAEAWSQLQLSCPTGSEQSVAFLYHFNCPNRWEGRWKGHATHDLDLMFALQNYRHHLAPGQQHCSDKFTRDLVRFVHGQDPWPAFSGSGHSGAMVYSAPMERDQDGSAYVADATPDRVGRRNIIQRLVKPSLYDKVFDAWSMFMQGPGPYP